MTPSEALLLRTTAGFSSSCSKIWNLAAGGLILYEILYYDSFIELCAALQSIEIQRNYELWNCLCLVEVKCKKLTTFVLMRPNFVRFKCQKMREGEEESMRKYEIKRKSKVIQDCMMSSSDLGSISQRWSDCVHKGILVISWSLLLKMLAAFLLHWFSVSCSPYIWIKTPCSEAPASDLSLGLFELSGRITMVNCFSLMTD